MEGHHHEHDSLRRRRRGHQTKWQDGALLAEGKYMVIDHNQAVVTSEAPQDRKSPDSAWS
jgi:hypothetical protein